MSIINVASQVNSIITLCDSVYTLYSEYRDLNNKYIDILNDIIILKIFLGNIEHNHRLSGDIIHCLNIIKDQLARLYKKLKNIFLKLF